MKKSYEQPQIELITLELEDVILATSGGIEDLEQGITFGEDFFN